MLLIITGTGSSRSYQSYESPYYFQILGVRQLEHQQLVSSSSRSVLPTNLLLIPSSYCLWWCWPRRRNVNRFTIHSDFVPTVTSSTLFGHSFSCTAQFINQPAVLFLIGWPRVISRCFFYLKFRIFQGIFSSSQRYTWNHRTQKKISFQFPEFQVMNLPRMTLWGSWFYLKFPGFCFTP